MTVYVVMWESDEGFSHIESMYLDWLRAELECKTRNETVEDPLTWYAVREYEVS